MTSIECLLPYTNRVNIKTEVSINFDKLNDKINEYLKEFIKNKFENNCDKQLGYIIKIENVKVISNVISNFCTKVMFNVSFDTFSFYPSKDTVYKLNVSLIFEHGILILIDTIKILIPYSQLKEKYELNKEDKTYINKTNKKEKICIGNEIELQLTHFEYHNGGFNCMARLIC